jgi:hypothetical protein
MVASAMSSPIAPPTCWAALSRLEATPESYGVGGGRLAEDITGRSRSACLFRPVATTVRPPTARVAAVA